MAVTAPAGSGIPADSPLTTKEGWAAFVRHERPRRSCCPRPVPQTMPPATRRGGSTTRTCRW